MSHFRICDLGHTLWIFFRFCIRTDLVTFLSQMVQIVTHSSATVTKLFLFLFSQKMVRTKWNTAKHSRKKPPFLFSVRNPDRNGFYQRDLYSKLRPIKVSWRLFVTRDVYLCKVTFICAKWRLFVQSDVYLCKVTFICTKWPLYIYVEKSRGDTVSMAHTYVYVQSDVYLCKVTFICAKWPLNIYVEKSRSDTDSMAHTYVYVQSDVYLCKVTFICAKWLIHMCGG